VIQRQVIEASTDIVLVTDLSLPGVRDAMRLAQVAHDVAPQAKLHLVTSGIIDPRRSAVKVADLERTLKRKVACQIPADVPSALAAINFGKPLAEAAPNSPIVKALRPLVAALDRSDDEQPAATAATAASAFLRFKQALQLKKK
jgi:pilus assembly protein CpaE